MSRPLSTVGIVCCDVTSGGAEKATYILARRWRGFGMRIVWFCFADRADAVRARLAAVGADWPLVPLPSHDMRARAEALRHGLDRHAVDLVLLPDHWHKSVFTDIEVAKDAGCRVVVAEHNAFHWPLDVCDFDLMRRRDAAYRRVDALTALSPMNVAWWAANGFRGKVVYMPNYLSFETPPHSADAAGAFGAAAGDRNEIVYMGRVCELKGAHLVLEAVGRAIREKGLRDAHLTFVGRFDSPEYEARLRTAAGQPELATHVTFTGQVDDVRPYLAKARILVMGSRIEGAPMVLMEAKSWSVPAVIFEMPYVDGTADGQGVVSVPYGDVDALAAAIASVCSDAALHGRLVREARASLAGFAAERTDARWRRLLDQLANGETPLDAGCEEVPAELALRTLLRGLAACAIPMAAFQERTRREDVALQVIRGSRPFRWLRRAARIAYTIMRKEIPLWADTERLAPFGLTSHPDGSA